MKLNWSSSVEKCIVESTSNALWSNVVLPFNNRCRLTYLTNHTWAIPCLGNCQRICVSRNTFSVKRNFLHIHSRGELVDVLTSILYCLLLLYAFLLSNTCFVLIFHDQVSSDEKIVWTDKFRKEKFYKKVYEIDSVSNLIWWNAVAFETTH